MALTDVLSLAEAKSATGNLHSGDDALLALYVATVSAYLDDACGPVVVRSVTEVHNREDSACLYVDAWPFQSVTSLVDYDEDAIATTTWTSSDYVLTPRHKGGYHSTIKLRSSHFGYRTVAVLSAGRFTDTASVSGPFKSAALLMLRNLWRQQEVSTDIVGGEYLVPGNNFPTFAFPNAAKGLLRDELRLGGIA